jgi:hypothetical protein
MHKRTGRDPLAESAANRPDRGRLLVQKSKFAFGPARRAVSGLSLLGLQRSAGNQAVQRLLGVGRQVVVQRWKEYTTEFAETLANERKIKLYPNRVDHILERHGPGGTSTGPTFHQFLSSKPGTLKWQIYKALESGRVVKSPGRAFDFEYTFEDVIGRDTDDDEAKTIRVVVVELGSTGELGKVQTAYPVP